MTKKTKIVLSFTPVTGPSLPHLRVKIDSRGYPYVVINERKVLVASTVFPRRLLLPLWYVDGTLDLVEGGDELAAILAPLTTDGLTPRELSQAG